ncbi:MAG TPA: hypothetical protein VLY46_05490, partial [Usitatibacter sp.]|nr:hypothetical protein [Usitatibacter sp.]
MRARQSLSGVAAPERIAAERATRLREYGVLDSPTALAALEELVRRAQDVARFPVAWISFLDGGRERLHAARGTDLATLDAGESIALDLGEMREAL